MWMFCKEDRCFEGGLDFPAVKTTGYKMIDVISVRLNVGFVGNR